MNVLLRFVQTLTAWVLPRPLLILVLAFALALTSLLVTYFKLDLETDQLKLISPNHPLIPLANKLEPFNFSGKTTFTIVIHTTEPERAVSFLKTLAARIEQDSEHFQDFFYRVNPDLMKRYALLYLDKEELLRLREDIKEYSGMVQELARRPDLLTFLKRINQEMASRMVGEFFTGFLDDKDSGKEAKGEKEPMDLSSLIYTLEGLDNYFHGLPDYKSPWAPLFKKAEWNLDLEGYFWEAGKKYLLSFVIPRSEGDGFAEGKASLDYLRELIRQTQAAFGDVEAGVTGRGALTTDEMTTATRDMDKATLLSLLGVALLMVVFFWSLRRPLAEMITLGVGVCWTMGLTTLVIGHLNILSVVFAPLLCGLGVDFGIHWFARFEEEEQKDGRTPKEVIWEVTTRSGPGILLAGLSTAFCFLPFILTTFRGLVELGMITCMGILLISIAVFTVLPALSIFLAGRRRPGSPGICSNGRDLIRFSARSAYLVLVAALFLSLLGALSAKNVQFDLNPLRLQAKNAESVIWEKTMLENSKRPLISAAAFASSPEEVEAKSATFAKLSTVSEVVTVFDLLPKHQKEKILLIHDMFPEFPQVNPTSVTSSPADLNELAEILERIRFKMQEDQAGKWGAKKPLVEQMAKVRSLSEDIIKLIQHDANDLIAPFTVYRKRFQEDLIKTWDFFREATSASRMGVMDLPKFLRDWFLHDGQYLIRIYPEENIWDGGALARFVRQLQSVDPKVAGEPVSLYAFANAYKSACLQASIYALVIIFILLVLTFRQFSLAILALVPLLIGTLWTVAIMGLVGIDFNMANGVFMPLVVGAGVEYGVIILNRWRERTVLPGHLPCSTGKGVILAALTTTFGFGTLMISSHQGIFSLGFVSFVGSLCVLAAAIILIPAVLAVGPRRLF